MRKIKYFVSIAFILLTFLFISDMYVWNIESFETPYISTTMYLNDGISQSEMIQDITRVSKEKHCEVFLVNRERVNLYHQIVSVYGTDGVADHLAKNSFLAEGRYKSLFLGETDVEVQSLEKVEDISKSNTFYMIGSMQDAREIKSLLVDQYDGNFPKEGYVYFNGKRTVFLIWTIGLFLFLLLTLYETALLKKEIMIRFIYGDSLKNTVMKRILYDEFVYGLIIFASYLILKQMMHLQVDFHLPITVLCFLLFGILETLIYLRLFFADYKSDISSRKSEKAVLRISYFYKATTSIFIVIIMSASIELIIGGLSYYRQKDFFKMHDDYSYLSILSGNHTSEDTDAKMIEIYIEQARKGKSFSSVFLDSGPFTQRPCLLMDKGSMEYLEPLFPELQEMEKNDSICFLVPEGMQKMGVKDLSNLLQLYYKSEYTYKVIEYDTPRSVIGIFKQDRIVSKLYQNPLIVINTDSENFKHYFNGLYISFATMFQISESEWSAYMDAYHLDKNLSYFSNVYENYLHSLKEYQRNILLGLVAFLFLILMDLIVTKATLSYECNIHAVEITIKTVLGDSVFSKYNKIILTTIISGFCSMIGCMIMMLLLQVSSLPYLLIGYFIIALIELLFILYYIRKIEKVNINKVLKGGHI